MDPTLPSRRTPGAAPDPAPSGRVIAGKYHLLERLGRGGVGEVFRALQVGLGREVAIKLIRDTDPTARARFLREARVAAEIRHPCVVAIHDAGVDDDGTPYCAMELLDGETLDARLERDGRLPPTEAVALAASIASALRAVHAKGFLHRDVKPANIFLARREDGGVDPKLIDFGIAKRVAVEPEIVRRATRGRLPPTSPGLIVGTPRYLAPEQILGTALDERCDVYALATTLYEMLAGAPPFHAEDMGRLLASIVCDAPAPIADVPAALDREVRRALAKEPAERPASVADFAAALWSALAHARMDDSTPPEAAALPLRSRAPLAIAISVAAAIVIGIIIVRRSTPPPAPVAIAPGPTALPTAVVPAEPAPPAPEVVPAATAIATAAPHPRPKSAPVATASAPQPEKNLRMDDLKVPF